MSDEKFDSLIMKVIQETKSNPLPSMISIKSHGEYLSNLPKKVFAKFEKQCPEEIKVVQKYHPINVENFLQFDDNNNPDLNQALQNYRNCFEKHNRDYLNYENKFGKEMKGLKIALNTCISKCSEKLVKKTDNEVESCVRECVHTSFDNTDVLIKERIKIYSQFFP